MIHGARNRDARMTGLTTVLQKQNNDVARANGCCISESQKLNDGKVPRLSHSQDPLFRHCSEWPLIELRLQHFDYQSKVGNGSLISLGSAVVRLLRLLRRRLGAQAFRKPRG